MAQGDTALGKHPWAELDAEALEHLQEVSNPPDDSKPASHGVQNSVPTGGADFHRLFGKHPMQKALPMQLVLSQLRGAQGRQVEAAVPPGAKVPSKHLTQFGVMKA